MIISGTRKVDEPMNELYWHYHSLNKSNRSDIKKQKPLVIWLTGLSSSGKSTIANALEQKLHDMNFHTYLLDGDNIRHHLCKDLGFSENDRVENMRRVGEVSKLMVDAGLIVITAFISPFTKERNMVRRMFESGEFIEVFVDTPIEICEARDPKGLYRKARLGEIENFTGISSPYEKPKYPELHLNCANSTIDQSTNSIYEHIKNLIHIHE